MKTRINIRRHGFVEKMYGIILAKFQPNWLNGCRLGVQNVCVVRQNFPSEIKRKIDFLRHLTWNEIMTPKRLFWSIPERDQLSLTIGLWQVTCNRNKLSRHATGNTLLPVSSIQIHCFWTQDNICRGERMYNYRFVCNKWSASQVTIQIYRGAACRNRSIFAFLITSIIFQPLLLFIKRALVALRQFRSPFFIEWFLWFLRSSFRWRKRTRPFLHFRRHLQQSKRKKIDAHRTTATIVRVMLCRLRGLTARTRDHVTTSHAS